MRSSRAGRLLTAAWLVLPLASLAGDRQLYEAVEPHMGTLVRIKLYAASAEQASAAFRAAFGRIAQLDDELSDYKTDSELNRICRTAVGRPVAVSADLFEVLAASQKLAAETAGAFDVTLGPVIRLWRQARKDIRLPSAAALREAAAHTGYRKLHLDPQAQAVMLDEPGMQLDVGGIAKGHLVREIDALDGLMARAADQGGIQFRVLNRRKGPAVRGPRAQADRKLYAQAMQHAIRETANLTVIEGEVDDLLIGEGAVTGVRLADGRELGCGATVLTTGTFLRGLIHIGERQIPAGRVGEASALGLSLTLERLGFALGRLKTIRDPLPAEVRTPEMRRFGFHGLSFEYLMQELARQAGEDAYPICTVSGTSRRCVGRLERSRAFR